MSVTARSHGPSIARRAVSMALDAGATQAEALVHEDGSALTRFANNELHQSVAETDTSVSLRFVDGQRIGGRVSAGEINRWVRLHTYLSTGMVKRYT